MKKEYYCNKCSRCCTIVIRIVQGEDTSKFWPRCPWSPLSATERVSNFVPVEYDAKDGVRDLDGMVAIETL